MAKVCPEFGVGRFLISECTDNPQAKELSRLYAIALYNATRNNVRLSIAGDTHEVNPEGRIIGDEVRSRFDSPRVA